MKKLILLLLVMIPFCLQAQKKTGGEKLGWVDAVSNLNKGKDTVWVFDGEPKSYSEVKEIAKRIDTSTIAEVVLLKNADEKATDHIYSSHRGGVVIINTKAYLTKQYQEKFSKFSLEYKNYLDQHSNDDAAITYDLAGLIIKNNYPRKLVDLYQFGADKIKAVRFEERTPSEGPLLTIQMIY